MSRESTGEILLKLAQKHGADTSGAEDFIRREKWIQKSQDWLDGQAEREALQNESGEHRWSTI